MSSEVSNRRSEPDGQYWDASFKQDARTRRRAARAPNKVHRACFWTWPWGHVWRRKEIIGPRLDLWKCDSCGKTQVF